MARRLLPSLLDRLDAGHTSTAALAGAALSLAIIQLLATPLEQLSGVNVQVLAVRSVLFLAPLLVSLLQLLQRGPLLLAPPEPAAALLGAVSGAVPGGSAAGGPGARTWGPAWRAWGPELMTELLVAAAAAAVVLPYVVAAAVVAAVFTRPELDTLHELRFLVGSLDPRALLTALLQAALFGALVSGLCLRQARRAGAGSRGQSLSAAQLMSQTVSRGLVLLLAIDLAWILLLDPLELAGRA